MDKRKMMEKERETVLLFTNKKMTKCKNFDIFIINGEKTIFHHGGEYKESDINGGYERRQNGFLQILTKL